MDKQRIEYLHQGYLAGTLSAEELAEWTDVLRSGEHEATIHALMHATWAAITPRNQQTIPPTRAQRIFGRIIRPSYGRKPRLWLSAAAALLLASAAFWFVWITDQPVTQAVLTTEDITPGNGRATLSLADGTTIDLSEAQTGIIVGDGITYLDGTAVEGGAAAADQQLPDTGEYVLRTPTGSTYQIKLPDGTEVWLNAASTLTYPRRFSGTDRSVTLVGEAYFSVAKDAGKPFVVHSRDQRIGVVGTAFNVSAYPNDAATTTTLINGSVNVRAVDPPLHGEAAVHHLRPGQQSTLQQGTFHIREVDTDQFTAWRDGRFDFDGKTLPEVMRELARWYGVKVAYDGVPPDLTFYGGAQRSDNLAMVLALLETNGIRYQLSPDTTLILSTAGPENTMSN